MKQLFSICCGLLITITVGAQKKSGFNFLTPIADSLKKNAHAVYRLDEATLEMLTIGKYKFTTHQIITVLDKEGFHHLKTVLNGGKNFQLNTAEIVVYDELGAEIKKYKKKDFQLVAATDEVSLLTDSKLYVLEAVTASTPFTIDITIEYEHKNFIELPDFYIGNENESVEKCLYTVITKPDNDIRYKNYHCSKDPVIEVQNGVKTYFWEYKNIPAKPAVKNTYESRYYWPLIEISPSHFEYDEFKGDMSSWKSLGAWHYNLYQEETPFDTDKIEIIKKKVSGLLTDKEKIAVLYHFLQDNFRYVSIQLGIGGLKPFPVGFVDTKKYGDCKSLSNYMVNLLKVVGIKAYPALINSGYDNPPVDPLFPSERFNHVIVCVPGVKDSVWLECTSKTNSPGVLGSFTENKKALLLTENGGVLVNTPDGNYQDNELNTSSWIQLDEEGGASTKTTLSCKGNFRDYYDEVQQLNPNDQKSFFVNYFRYRAIDEMKMDSFHLSGATGIMQVKGNFEQLFDFKAGAKYFFHPSLNKITIAPLDYDSSRSLPLVLRDAYIRRDTTVFQLGDKYVVDNIQKDIEFKNAFASYRFSAVQDTSNKTLTIFRTFTLFKHIIPAEHYQEMVHFVEDVTKADNNKIVLKKL